MQRKIFGALGHSSQVKVMRQRILQHDLEMYAAISGKRPSLPVSKEPRERTVKVATAARARSWSPAVLAAYLGNLPVSRAATRVFSPEMAQWVRRMSAQALERLHEAHDRLILSKVRSDSRTRPSKE